MSSHIVIAVYLCAATCQPQQLRVWDGDSFLIGMKHGSERVRVLGLDTAEIEGKCSYEIRMAQKAKRRLAELADGQRMALLQILNLEIYCCTPAQVLKFAHPEDGFVANFSFI